MSYADVKKLVVLVRSTNLSYNEEPKAEFHRLAKKVAKDVAKELDLAKGAFEVRSNMAGIAVSGEVTLHAYNVYIQFDQSFIQGQFMYRHCDGLKDYSGGVNRWMNWGDLLNWDKAIQSFRSAQAGR